MELRELRAGETGLAFEAMRELRTYWDDEAAFVERVDSVQRPEGYRLVAGFLPHDSRASAVAGFRQVHNLAWGDTLYIDDLSTRRDARRHGLASALMTWLFEEARRLGCNAVHLDSGVGAEREDAHRLYFNHRLRITSYHFARELD
jgi:GNAT superfamily N-acetyltransferase